MNEFKIKAILDNNNIQVTPNWTWRDRKGKEIRVRGLFAKKIESFGNFKINEKLQKLLLDKYIVMKNPEPIFTLDGKIAEFILCDIYLNGVNVINYFPEIK